MSCGLLGLYGNRLIALRDVSKNDHKKAPKRKKSGGGGGGGRVQKELLGELSYVKKIEGGSQVNDVCTKGQKV